jgi:hypothetical protein
MMEHRDKPDRGADAAKLCALVFLNGKTLARFSIPVELAIEQAGLPLRRFQEAFAWAISSGWIRRRPTHIELTAAGIYVAKAYLDLPRQREI